ncbi:MAG: hypothetical protein ACTSRP_24000 [Candidatus Helarchaeota archaeon]
MVNITCYLIFNSKYQAKDFCSQNLCLLIQTKRKYYKLNEPVYLDVRLINNSKRSYLVYSELIHNYNIYFNIQDSFGNTIPCLGIFPEPVMRGLCDYILLEPNEYIGKIIQLNNKDIGCYFYKGEYIIEANYEWGDIFLQELKGKGEVLNKEMRDMFWTGILKSNEIKIIVR